MGDTLLSVEQVEDLLDNVIGVSKRTHWKGNKCQFCCPVHGETHPSCGVNIEYHPKDITTGQQSDETFQVFHCFSCGAKGSLAKLLYESTDDFKSVGEAYYYLVDRYSLEPVHDLSKLECKEIIRYGESDITSKVSRVVLPRKNLAPFRSGKETYKYFFDRGFSKEDMIKFQVGRDLENETVTFPVFWEDSELAGFIGRFIDPRRLHNSRFKIYNFNKGDLIYGLDKVRPINDTIIGVEAILDVILMHKWNYCNTVGYMGSEPTYAQLKQISDRCSKYIHLMDDDEAGHKSAEYVGRFMKSQGVEFLQVDYSIVAKSGKDPGEWGEELTNELLDSAYYITKGLPRL